MATTAPTRRSASDIAGYVVAIVVNAAVWYVINVWPGWQAAGFLTEETAQVIGLVNLSVIAAIVANVVYLATSPRWVPPLGDLITTGIAVAAMVRIVQVFPFTFDHWSFDAAPLVRFALIVGIVGASIAMIVQFVTLMRAVIVDDGRPAPRGGSGVVQ